MSQTSDDGDLIAASLSDPALFARVFDEHFDSVSSFLRRRSNAAIADELTSQTFLLAFRSRASFDRSRRSAKPWLLGIATNLLRHHFRGGGREARALERLERPTQPEFTEEAIDRADASRRRAELVSALFALTPDERDVLLLFAWADLSYGEIAEALDVPVGTVRSRLSRARSRMEQLTVEFEPQTEHQGAARSD